MHTIVLQLDELDAKAIHKALAVRQRFRINGQCALPDYDGNLPGVLLAEICRDWLGALGEWDFPATSEDVT